MGSEGEGEEWRWQGGGGGHGGLCKRGGVPYVGGFLQEEGVGMLWRRSGALVIGVGVIRCEQGK